MYSQTQALDDSNPDSPGGSEAEGDERVRLAILKIQDIEYDIYRGENSIGRQDCEIILESKSISSRHAVIEVEDAETHIIYDRGSLNGTKLKKNKLKPLIRYNIEHGDEIWFSDILGIYFKVPERPTEDGNESDSSTGSESMFTNVLVPETPLRQNERRNSAAEASAVVVAETPESTLVSNAQENILGDDDLFDTSTLSVADKSTTNNESVMDAETQINKNLNKPKAQRSTVNLKLFDDDESFIEDDFIPATQGASTSTKNNEHPNNKDSEKKNHSAISNTDINKSNDFLDDIQFSQECIFELETQPFEHTGETANEGDTVKDSGENCIQEKLPMSSNCAGKTSNQLQKVFEQRSIENDMLDALTQINTKLNVKIMDKTNSRISVEKTAIDNTAAVNAKNTTENDKVDEAQVDKKTRNNSIVKDKVNEISEIDTQPSTSFKTTPKSIKATHSFNINEELTQPNLKLINNNVIASSPCLDNSITEALTQVNYNLQNKNKLETNKLEADKNDPIFNGETQLINLLDINKKVNGNKKSFEFVSPLNTVRQSKPKSEIKKANVKNMTDSCDRSSKDDCNVFDLDTERLDFDVDLCSAKSSEKVTVKKKHAKTKIDNRCSLSDDDKSNSDRVTERENTVNNKEDDISEALTQINYQTSSTEAESSVTDRTEINSANKLNKSVNISEELTQRNLKLINNNVMASSPCLDNSITEALTQVNYNLQNKNKLEANKLEVDKNDPIFNEDTQLLNLTDIYTKVNGHGNKKPFEFVSPLNTVRQNKPKTEIKNVNIKNMTGRSSNNDCSVFDLDTERLDFNVDLFSTKSPKNVTTKDKQVKNMLNNRCSLSDSDKSSSDRVTVRENIVYNKDDDISEALTQINHQISSTEAGSSIMDRTEINSANKLNKSVNISEELTQPNLNLKSSVCDPSNEIAKRLDASMSEALTQINYNLKHKLDNVVDECPRQTNIDSNNEDSVESESLLARVPEEVCDDIDDENMFGDFYKDRNEPKNSVSVQGNEDVSPSPDSFVLKLSLSGKSVENHLSPTTPSKSSCSKENMQDDVQNTNTTPSRSSRPDDEDNNTNGSFFVYKLNLNDVNDDTNLSLTPETINMPLSSVLKDTLANMAVEKNSLSSYEDDDNSIICSPLVRRSHRIRKPTRKLNASKLSHSKRHSKSPKEDTNPEICLNRVKRNLSTEMCNSSKVNCTAANLNLPSTSVQHVSDCDNISIVKSTRKRKEKSPKQSEKTSREVVSKSKSVKHRKEKSVESKNSSIKEDVSVTNDTTIRQTRKRKATKMGTKEEPDSKLNSVLHSNMNDIKENLNESKKDKKKPSLTESPMENEVCGTKTDRTVKSSRKILNNNSTANIKNKSKTVSSPSTTEIKLNQEISNEPIVVIKKLKSDDLVQVPVKKSRRIAERNKTINSSVSNPTQPQEQKRSRKASSENNSKRLKCATLPNSPSPCPSNASFVYDVSNVGQCNVSNYDEKVAKSKQTKNFKVTKGKSENSIATRSSRRKVENVLFTGMYKPKLEELVEELGGHIVDSSDTCTVLVTDKIRRTVKLMCGLGRGVPIVSLDWLQQSKNSGRLLDPWKYLIVDKEAENKFSFNLKKSLQMAKKQKCFANFFFYATPSVLPSPKDLEVIINSCGGNYLKRVPESWPQNSVLISCIEDDKLWKKIKNNTSRISVVVVEAILSGVLQQNLDIKYFKID